MTATLTTISTAELEALLAARHADTAAEKAAAALAFAKPIADGVLSRTPLVHAKTSAWIGASETYPFTDPDTGHEWTLKLTLTAKNPSAKALAGPRPA